MKTGRKWAAKVFLGFIVIMAVCTALSRAAASALVAQVEVESAGRGRLSYSYEGEGSVVPKKEKEMFLWEGQQVEWTAVKGNTVKKGKCLVRFRKEYLEQVIEKKQSEITQLELQEKGQQISARKPARVSAAEGAYQTLNEAKKNLERAQAAEKKAKEKLSADDNDELKKQELKEAYQAAKSETEAARKEKSQAQAAYDLAKKEDAAQDKNNADAQEAAKTSAQALSEQVEDAKKELEVLKGYKKADGEMLAEQDCTVMENDIQIGVVTAGTEYLVLGYGGWKLEGEMLKENKDKLAAGRSVSVQFPSGGRAETEIESVETVGSRPDEEAEETAECFWYGTLPDEAEIEEGQTFSWKIEVESEEEYEQVIPLTALREDVSGAYCLILTETEQMLGTVQTAKRVPVTVLEKDGTNAAITSELRKEDQIIVSSEKYVAGGDRIRIKE